MPRLKEGKRYLIPSIFGEEILTAVKIDGKIVLVDSDNDIIDEKYYNGATLKEIKLLFG